MMILLALFAFLGGLIRGMIEYLNYGKGNIFLLRFFLVIIFLGIIGLVAGLAIYSTGLITVANIPGQLIVIILASYAGTDLINSLYVILVKKRIEL